MPDVLGEVVSDTRTEVGETAIVNTLTATLPRKGWVSGDK